MKIRTISTVLIISLLTLSLLAGCSGGSDTGNSGDADNTAAEPVAAAPEVVEQEISEQITESADTEVSTDAFEGSWVGVDDESLFVNITKEGDKYKYEDNDGAYEAALSDGILKVTVAEGDFAEVYVDKETGNLVLTYMDSMVSYMKK